jgi:hypothetical protein
MDKAIEICSLESEDKIYEIATQELKKRLGFDENLGEL